MSDDDLAILTLARRSPSLAETRDAEGWLALFASDGYVLDPSSSVPWSKAVVVRGRNQLERFYAAFIAPNRIRFEVHGERVLGNRAIREVTIHTTLALGVTLHVPAEVHYTVEHDGEELRLRSLVAHWPVLRMVGQLLRRGPAGLGAGLVMAWHMLRHLGLRGYMGYGRAIVVELFTGPGPEER